mgnify:CR=1 FL=1
MSESPKTTTTNIKFKRIECPFNLETIFTMQFSTQGLKSVLEFILEHIGTLDETTVDHLAKLVK